MMQHFPDPLFPYFLMIDWFKKILINFRPAESINISLPKLDSKLVTMIKNVGNSDQYVAHASLNELGDILNIQERQAVLRDYEEIYMASVLQQFKVGFTSL